VLKRTLSYVLPPGRLPLDTLPSILSELGIHSLMVEGGASIIQQFLATSCPPSTSQDKEDHWKPLVDRVIVTIAPVFIPDGFGLADGWLDSDVSFVDWRTGTSRC
jgi:riboflavin biosynthesis pyrimidine reductase